MQLESLTCSLNYMALFDTLLLLLRCKYDFSQQALARFVHIIIVFIIKNVIVSQGIHIASCLECEGLFVAETRGQGFVSQVLQQ